MRHVIKYLESNPTVEEMIDRIVNLERTFTMEKTISAQIRNQDEREMLEAIVKWANYTPYKKGKRLD